MAGCRHLTDDEISKLRGRFKNLRDKLLFVLGVKTGFRIKELLSLTIGDVILADYTVAERIKVSRRNMKGGIHSREVVVHDEAKDLIAEYVNSLESYEFCTPLFKSGSTDKAISRKHAWEILKTAYEEVGAFGPTGTHSLRKTFSMKVFKASGNNVLVTQKALGHSSSLTTEKYLDIKQDEVDAIVKMIG